MAEHAFAKMKEQLSESLKWSSLSVTMDDIAKEHKALVRDLSGYDPCIAVPLISSLLTVPKYQSNCQTLELLTALAWRHCNGKKKAHIGQVARWFRNIRPPDIIFGEDPAEDVFVSLVIGRDDDFRILEGLWESSGFYTQVMYDIVAEMPDEDHWTIVRKRVDSVLTVSDIVCRSAGLSRYQLGSDEPQKALKSRNLPDRNELIQRVRIPFDTLQAHGIRPEDIAPFMAEAKEREEAGNQQAALTGLHLKPFTILEPDVLTVALPTCLSIAMREYVIGEIVDHGLEDDFDRMLAKKFSELLTDTPLLGGPEGAPFHWRRVQEHRVSSFDFRFDEGHFISLHCFLPRVRTHADGGFSKLLSDDGIPTEEIRKDILNSMDRLEREDGFQAGLILSVVGGWGKGWVFGLFEGERANWRFVSISFADLIRVSWLGDMSPDYFWRIQEGLLAVERQGVEIVNLSGVLNLMGWVRSNDGHFVPHAQLQDEPVTPNRPLTLFIPSNMIGKVRAEADGGYDRHGVSDETGRRHVVQRPSPNPFFESEGSKRLYASMTDVRTGTLTSCYEGQVRLWLSIGTPNLQDRKVVYGLWEMANEWLHRIGLALDRKLGSEITEDPIRTNLRFLDTDIPDGLRAKPSLSELEELCTIDVSQDLRNATVTLGTGFMDGFRVAENIAERAIVKAVLSAFLQLTLGRLPEGMLDELEGIVVPNVDARSVHVTHLRGLSDRVHQWLPAKVISINSIDEGIAKLGLAWRVRDRSNGSRVVGREECTEFLNEVVDCLLSDIEQELRTLPRLSLLRMIVRNIEKANAEEDRWRRTSAALLGLHGQGRESRQTYAREASKRAAAGIASRVLAEMGVCMCPLQGTVQPTALSLSRLMSRALLVVRFGGLSDAIRYDALQPELTLSALGDILFRNDFGENVAEPVLEHILSNRFVQISANQKKIYDEPGTAPEIQDPIDERFEAIWLAEMGFDLGQARRIMGSLEDLAVRRQALTFELRRSEVIASAVDDNTVDGKAMEAFLAQFCLAPRPCWDKVPEGFNKKDIYPWRYGRRLSFVTRPIIQIDEDNDPFLLIAPCSLRNGFDYLVTGAYLGRLEQSFFRTNGMRNDWLSAANEGHKFATSIGESLLELDWSVECSVPLTKILNKGLDRNFGDVDVLAWRKDRPEVLVVECKHLQPARNYSEISAMFSEYQGKVENGKRDKLRRHLDRVDLLLEHQEKLGHYINKDRFEVVSCLCCSGTVPMQYSRIEALGNTRVCSPEELLSAFRS